MLMPNIRPEEPAAPMLPPAGGSGSGADNDESRLAEIEAKLAVSLKPPTPEPEIEPSPEELARIREQELAKLLAEEERSAKLRDQVSSEHTLHVTRTQWKIYLLVYKCVNLLVFVATAAVVVTLK